MCKLKQVFFTVFDSFVVLTTRSDAEILRPGDFCADDRDNNGQN